MTDDQLRELFAAVRDLMQPHLTRSDPLRRAAEAFGHFLIAEAHRAGAGGEFERGGAVSARALDAVTGPAQHSNGQETSSKAVVPLRLGDETVELAVEGEREAIKRARDAADRHSAASPEEPTGDGRTHRWTDASEFDLELIERRSMLKAQASRLFIERRAARYDPIAERPILDRMESMIAAAKEMPNCFIWVFWTRQTPPPDDALRSIALCYEALARTIALVRRTRAMGDRVRGEQSFDAVQLLAEANSALRVALEQTWLTSPDTDQLETHLWLRRLSERERIYLPRYMRLDDAADPDRAPEVMRETLQIAEAIDAHAGRMKQIDEGFKKIAYHVRQLNPLDIESNERHYTTICDTIAFHRELGVPPSDSRYRRVLDAAAVREFPPELSASAGVAAVLESLAEWHAMNVEDDDRNESSSAEGARDWSAQVHEVRSLLAGRAVVMIGGESRVEAEERIKQAFALSELFWAPLSEHGSAEPMRAPINRPETALVIVLIRFAGHQHAEEANACAREAGKPCVFLKAGYNPEQIADAVLQQVSDQLRQGAAVS